MANFQRQETVICEMLVKTVTGGLTSPSTSMKITITDPVGAIVVNSQPMVKDAEGTYHYDYNPAGNAVSGYYQVLYVAIDGTRTTVQEDNFLLA